MAGFAEWHVNGAVGAVLESLGVSAESAEVRDIVPTAARGHNLVFVAPPAAVHAVPALAGAVSHTARDGQGLRALILTPLAGLAGFERAVLPLATAAGLEVHAAASATRAARRLRDGSVGLLVTTPDTALALLERAALKLEGLRSLVLAWPEQFGEAEALAPLMAEVPKDAQRVVHTADAAAVNRLVERYARRAHTVGVEAHPAAPIGPVRTVTVADSARGEALREVLEVLDPERVTVWVANGSSAAEARMALAGSGAITVTAGDVAPGGTIVAYDLPSRGRLEQLVSAGEVVLLVPPQGEAWVERTTRERRPLRIADALDAAKSAAAERRRKVAARIEDGVADGSFYELAPLFERHDATRVAGALYELWRAAAASGGAAPAPVVMPVTETGKMWVGIGAMDKVTPNDLVAALVKDLKVDRSRIGKIEIREKFSLVELPAADVESVAAALTGKSVRRRRIIARADRGATPRGDRGPAPRGERPRKPRA